MTYKSSFFICALSSDLISAFTTTRQAHLSLLERIKMRKNQMFWFL